jgi:hypothetical protein
MPMRGEKGLQEAGLTVVGRHNAGGLIDARPPRSERRALMRDPLRVRVTGPLAPFAPAFVAELDGRGYARVSVVAQVQLSRT